MQAWDAAIILFVLTQEKGAEEQWDKTLKWKGLCENKGKSFGARIKILLEGQLVDPLIHCTTSVIAPWFEIRTKMSGFQMVWTIAMGKALLLETGPFGIWILNVSGFQMVGL